MRAIIQGREDLVTGKKYNKGKKKNFLFVSLDCQSCVPCLRTSRTLLMLEKISYFASKYTHTDGDIEQAAPYKNW